MRSNLRTQPCVRCNRTADDLLRPGHCVGCDRDDLLKACRMLLDVKELRNLRGCGIGYDPLTLRAIQEARAAIANARVH